MKSDFTTIDGEEARIAEANRRLEIVQAFSALKVAGKATREIYAALKARGSRATVDRYVKAYLESGGDFNSLIPGTDRCGRKSTAAKLHLTADEAAQISGLRLDTGSTTAALRLYAQSDRCRPELAEAILDPSRTSKHSIPPSIRAAVTTSKALDDAHRGPRALSLRGMWTPRKNDILPGDIFTSDDTTPIWAWWVPWVTSKEYPFGVKVLQGQFLPILDIASQKILTFVIIAREASSYRACDIWSLFGHTFDAIGVPRLGFQLERGSWEANVIRGEEVDYQEGEVSLSRRLGGLRQLPSNWTDWHEAKYSAGALKTAGEGARAPQFPKTLQTWTSYLPKSKSIEAAFNRMQTLEGTLWGCLGRNQQRNPYEKTKKIFEACKRGAADPREHFLSGQEMAEKLRAILNYLNNEPMEGEVFHGVPAQIFDQAMTERPLFRMQEDLAYLYRRDWKTLQIAQGYARVRLTHPITGQRYSLFYSNPGVFAGHEGDRVIVYYDRENFDRPAQIIDARGEFLCEAEYVDRVGSFLEGDISGHEMRRTWRNAVMSIYGTLACHAPSRQMPKEVESRRAEAVEGRRLASSQVEQAKVITARQERLPGEGRPPTGEPFRGSLRMQMISEEAEK
jgi:hypothetical protein